VAAASAQGQHELNVTRAATRKHTMVGQSILRGGEQTTFGGEFTKYNKINNNSENFRGRGKIVARGARLLLGEQTTNKQYETIERDFTV